MPSIFEDVPFTDEDLRTAIRVNSASALVALVGDFSTNLDARSLRIAMDMGVFDMELESSVRGNVRLSSACVEALKGFLFQTESFDLTHDPEFGPLKKPVKSQRLVDDSHQMASFVSDLVDRVVKERVGVVSSLALDFEGDLQNEDIHEVALKADRTMGMLMAYAAALNLPDAVRAINKVTPSAKQEGFPLDWLAPILGGQRLKFDKTLEMAPAFFAVFYSSTQALEAFYPKRIQAKEKSKPIAQELPMFLQHVDQSSILAINSIDMLKDFQPSYAPSTLALSWCENGDREKGVHKENQAALNRLACQALDAQANVHEYAPQIPAFQAVGAFDFSPEKTIEAALENGHPDFIDLFKGQVPWDKVDFAGASGAQPLLLRSIQASKTSDSKEGVEAAMVALMQMAVEDKRQGLFFQTTLHDGAESRGFYGKRVVQPIQALIENKFHKVLVGFFQNGTSPNEAPTADSFSPLVVAERMAATETLHVMRSFMARASAHGLLAEMDALPFQDKPRP